ncbi:MAG: exosortase/archaeosortase family protein [Chloroflexota bacterium]|nr:exosortase/archaeosortase family protein [Chloroflexota bacterium]
MQREETRTALDAVPGGVVSLALVVGLAVALAAFVAPFFLHAVEVWSTDEEFSYGFLIPPTVIGMIWWRRAALRRSAGRGAIAGLVIAVIAGLLMLLSRRIEIHVLGGLAVSPLLWGIAVYLWGWGAGRVLAFPLAFLVFGLGLYRGLLSSVGFALQTFTAISAGWSGHLLGLHVVRDGLVLQSESFAFVVAQTCSGMNSLLSLLALAALWMYVTHGKMSARAAVLLSVLPLVVVANTVRVTLVLFVATWLGQDAALGFFHGASSLVLFGMAVSGLLLVSRVVGCKFASFASQY